MSSSEGRQRRERFCLLAQRIPHGAVCAAVQAAWLALAAGMWQCWRTVRVLVMGEGDSSSVIAVRK